MQTVSPQAAIALGAIVATVVVVAAVVLGRPRPKPELQEEPPPSNPNSARIEPPPPSSSSEHRLFQPLASVLTAIKDVEDVTSPNHRADGYTPRELEMLAKRRAWVLEASQRTVPVPLQ